MRSGVWAAVVGAGLLAGCGTMGGAPAREALVRAPDACGPQRFEVYFAEAEARLTPAARQAIAMTATRLQGCEIRRVRVIGLADATGTQDANLTLSERRARAVAEALTAAGWPVPAFELVAVGDLDARSQGVNEPLRRRTEVLVEAASR